MDGAYWLSFFQIILIDLVLSSDNSVVIGMACRGLPPEQRRRAVIYGALGAVLLRIGLTGMAAWMLNIPWIKAVGGLLLLVIAVKLVREHEGDLTGVRYSKTMGQAVKTVVLADFVMSLDNVLAVAGAAHGDVSLVIFGLGLSIPLLMWGSTLVARLIDRYPFLLYVGAFVLVHTAFRMCIEDPALAVYLGRIPHDQMWIPLTSILFILIAARVSE
ncbi:MAG: TerC family protein [Brevibacillus sp.]|nr:TerC family protein [Brevibacillus sp.]